MAWLARARREPLVAFLLIGLSIFGVDRVLAARRPAADPRRIVVDDAFVEGLRARHRERTGREVAAAGDEALIREHAREEALYREALAAGLDAGDVIVRRRLVQKVELLVAASVEVPEPSEADLEAWREANAARLRTPRRTRLVHAFFARDRRGERASGDAREALARATEVAPLGDPFPRGSRIGPATDAQIDAAFGEGLAVALASLALGEWAGPIEGAYGVHLVRVEAREPERLPPLEELRERARAAWMEERRGEATERELARIVGSYEVVRE